MKQLSIKKRVVFWYAFSMIVIVSLIVFILLSAGDRLVQDNVKSDLVINTDRTLKDVYVTNKQLVIDDDIVYYMDGNYIAICQNNKLILSGLLPDDFPDDIPFQADTTRKIKSDSDSFYVYDRLINNKAVGKIWVRGVAKADITANAPEISFILKLFLIILPIMIIIAIFGGWYITRKAFLPLKQITKTVNEIGEGKDLSKRISLPYENSNDEIYQTAATFDKMLERVEESFLAEKQFTNDASHELRTPTTVIMSQCEYALSNLKDPEEIKESLEIILSQSTKMSSLISQLLTLARVDRGLQKLNKCNTDLGLLAEEAAMSFTRAAKDKNISINVDAPVGIYLNGDPAFLSRMFENLISNAIKYGKDGGHVWVHLQSLEGRILITVADDGIGIPADAKDKIWNRFYQVDPAKSNSNSLGLGLSLVKWIVEEHQGSIVIKDNKSGSSDFDGNNMDSSGLSGNNIDSSDLGGNNTRGTVFEISF